jgi:hypothetical protein
MELAELGRSRPSSGAARAFRRSRIKAAETERELREGVLDRERLAAEPRPSARTRAGRWQAPPPQMELGIEEPQD